MNALVMWPMAWRLAWMMCASWYMPPAPKAPQPNREQGRK